jgi:hypothetical protein
MSPPWLFLPIKRCSAAAPIIYECSLVVCMRRTSGLGEVSQDRSRYRVQVRRLYAERGKRDLSGWMPRHKFVCKA